MDKTFRRELLEHTSKFHRMNREIGERVEVSFSGSFCIFFQQPTPGLRKLSFFVLTDDYISEKHVTLKCPEFVMLK